MPPAGARHNLLEVAGLRVGFRTHSGFHDAVRDVSFRIPPGKTVALVGESGSGKSVISQSIMGILPRTGDILGGSITFRDPLSPEQPVDIAALPRLGPRCRRCAAAASA